MWNPNSISPKLMNELREAAESAYGDDTRHEGFVEHPDPSQGSCFVTAQWLAHRLGGYVGTKKGHFFWVSPDKKYVLDLCGDWFSHPVHQQPGPVMFKRATHPMWKGFRIIDDYPEHPRAQLFERRANAAMHHLAKTADLAGPTPYTGETPQQQEDWNLSAPLIHDEPGFDMASGDHTYQWIVANNQVHVSPAHSQDELAGHAQFDLNSTEPFAAGHVDVKDGHATWSVTTNISMRLLSNMLRGYSETVGWKFDGLVDPMGQEVHDDFGAHKSMYYSERHDGHLVMSETPLPHGKRVDIQGKTARVSKVTEGLQEWADDFGYRLAEWPGGGDMTDQMKTREHLDEFNRGDMKFQPERSNPDLDIENADLSCGKCGEEFDSMAALRMHHRDHEPHDEPLDQAKFPWPHDFDAPLGFGTQQVPQSQWDGTVAMVLPNWKAASRYPEFGQQIVNVWSDDWRFYGAYRSGQLIGYAAVDDLGSVGAIHTMRPDDTARILRLIQTHYEAGSVLPCNKAQERLLPRLGMVPEEWPRGIWKWANGQEPKDLISAQIPFVYDVQGNRDHRQGMISLGYPGQGTHEVMPRGGEKFTPGGIVEGIYEPGGKVTFISQTNVPWTTRQFAQLWYALYPQMEITSVERQLPDGSSHKLAGIKVADKLHDFLMNPKSRPDLQTPEGQRWLTMLDSYHNAVGPKFDALTPWLTREWKKGRVNHSDDGAIGHMYYHRPIGDPIPGQFGDQTPVQRVPLAPTEMGHWSDFLNANHPLRRGLGDIMKHDVNSLHDHVQSWSQAMEEAAQQKALEGGQVVHTTPEGYTVRQLNTPEELQAEGNSMGHCVGGYASSVASGDSLIYSLRDPQGVPHATAEIEPQQHEWTDSFGKVHRTDMRQTGDWPVDVEQRDQKGLYPLTHPIPHGGELVQIQGKANQEPLPEYKQQLRHWFESFPEEQRPTWQHEEEGEPLYDDQGYSHYDLDHPDLIPEWEKLNNGLAHRTVPQPDDYGIIRQPTSMTADYDDLLDNIAFRSFGYYDTPDKDHINDIYRLAKERGEIPHLAKALEGYGEQQQENFDNWMDTNYEYAPRYVDPGDPHGWEDEDDEEGDQGKPYWQPEGEQGERYHDPLEAEKAYDAAINSWTEQHPGMQATNHMYNLINPHWNGQEYQNEPVQKGVFQ